MGLDAYLSRYVYVGNEYVAEDKRVKLVVPEGANIKVDDIDEAKISFIEVTVMYWRKANHIHRWFVENVQDGNDDCDQYYVSREQLQSLVETCKAVLMNPASAETRLPRQSGFFFGSTDYNADYFEVCRQTVEVLSKELSKETFDSYYYRSSW